MQNKRRENTNTNLTKGVRTEQASFSKFLRVLGGATIVFFVIKGLKKLFAPYNPPIIIKSGSFIIGTRKDFGDLEGDSDPVTEDDDLIEPSYFRRKRTNIEIRCVVVFERGRPIRCIKFPSTEADPGRCIIKFYFGDGHSPGSPPDILVKGRKFRIRSKGVLNTTSGPNSHYYYRHTEGGILRAIVFKRVGTGVPVRQAEIIFPADGSVHLVLDSDPSRYPGLC